MQRHTAKALIAASMLLLLSACNSQPNGMQMASLQPQAQTPQSFKWDEAVAATTMSAVSNSNMISMR